MYKLNDLRNGLAHSFFRVNRKQKLPTYGGQSIYTLDEFKAYRQETSEINQYFVRRL